MTTFTATTDAGQIFTRSSTHGYVACVVAFAKDGSSMATWSASLDRAEQTAARLRLETVGAPRTTAERQYKLMCPKSYEKINREWLGDAYGQPVYSSVVVLPAIARGA